MMITIDDSGGAIMSIIICSECGKEISDKSEVCIHCGYPLINYTCNINGIEYNLKEELAMTLVDGEDWIKAIGSLRKKTNLTLVDGSGLIEIIRNTKKIPTTFTPKYPLQNRNELDKNNSSKIECPYCHSADTKKITNTSKAVHTAVFGIFSIGRNSKNFHCSSCGSDF